MANERNGLAAATASDNSTAENLSNEDFFFEGEDGTLIGPGDDSDSGEEVSVDDAALGTETPEEQGEEGDGTVEGEVPAGQQPGSQPAAKPAVAPSAAPVTPPPPQAPASGSAPPQRVPTFHEHISANFPAAVEHIVANGAFRLSKEEAEIIDEAAVPVIERASAKVYLQAISTMSRMLHEALPAAVNSLVGVRDDTQKNEKQFFENYGFDPAVHKGEITKIAQYIRFSNPSLTGKPYADEVARMSYSMLGVAPPAKKPAANGQAKPGVPAQPGQRVVSKKAFTPAAKGGGGQPQNRKGPGTPPQKIDPLADLSKMLSSGVEMDD